MVNNFKNIMDDREAMLPPELEDRMTQHAGNLSVFGKVVELFLPNALQTVVRLIGGNELPCIKDRRRSGIEPEWRNPPEPAGPGEE
jgi:hypothetical protein